MKQRSTFDMPMARCACGATLNAVTSVGHAAEPKPGDVTVCAECGRVYRFDAGLGLRAATIDELKDDLSEEDLSMLRQAQAGLRRGGNRRERRASRAKKRSEAPPGYERTCQRMAATLRTWLVEHPGETPRFALPPERIAVIGGIDQVPNALARDAHAREILDRFCVIGREEGGPGGVPTVMMLWWVVRSMGLPTETASLAEFGELKVLSRGSNVEN